MKHLCILILILFGMPIYAQYSSIKDSIKAESYIQKAIELINNNNEEDEKIIIAYYNKAIKLGSINSVFALCEYLTNIYEGNDLYDKIECIASPLATKGNQKAKYLIALNKLFQKLYNGESVSNVNNDIIIHCFRDIDTYANNCNDSTAWQTLAMCYDEGVGTKPDKQKAFEYFYKAAEKGLAYAEYKIAEAFEKGEVVKTNSKLAFYWMLESAEGKNPNAEYCVALMYHSGYGISQSYENARNWYERCKLRHDFWMTGAVSTKEELEHKIELCTKKISDNIEFPDSLYEIMDNANANDPYAQYLLAKIFTEGKMADQDPIIANWWCNESCYKKFAPAMSLLGIMYNDNKEYDKAEELFLSAMEQNDTTASICLSMMYNNKNSGKYNVEKAFLYAQKAYNQGTLAGKLQLANNYRFGIGTQKNLEEAIKLFKEAAKFGSKEAYRKLGQIYYFTEGPINDKKIGEEYFRKSCNSDSEHYFYLAKLKEEENNPQKAFSLYEKSFNLGYIDAGVAMAGYFEHGYGVNQDIEASKNIYLQLIQKLEDKKKIVTIQKYIITKFNSNAVKNPEPIDLGLSVKWASCNIGATKEWDFGNYYSWGEKLEKLDFNHGNYKYYHGRNIKKYCTKPQLWNENSNPDSICILQIIDDVANFKLGKGWRIPRKEEFEELQKKCKWDWTSINQIQGYKITGPNGKSIFLPAVKIIDKSISTESNIYGLYWTSNLDSRNNKKANAFLFDSQKTGFNGLLRYEGLPIRAIYK